MTLRIFISFLLAISLISAEDDFTNSAGVSPQAPSKSLLDRIKEDLMQLEGPKNPDDLDTDFNSQISQQHNFDSQMIAT